MKTTTKLIGIVSALIVAQVAVQSKRLKSHLQAQVRSLRRIKNQLDHHLRQSQMKKMTIRPQQ